jgi:hypothetical protein
MISTRAGSVVGYTIWIGCVIRCGWRISGNANPFVANICQTTMPMIAPSRIFTKSFMMLLCPGQRTGRGVGEEGLIAIR